MTTLEIKNNGWNVHISLEKLNTCEIGTIFKEIAEGDFYWRSFIKGDDVRFDGDINLTCTYIDEEYSIIKFEKLTVLEKFCVALENGVEFDFLHDEETYSQLTKADMRTIIANMLTVIECKESIGTNILEEIIDDIRKYAVD